MAEQWARARIDGGGGRKRDGKKRSGRTVKRGSDPLFTG
jgi:hypothetical protein